MSRPRRCLPSRLAPAVTTVLVVLSGLAFPSAGWELSAQTDGADAEARAPAPGPDATVLRIANEVAAFRDGLGREGRSMTALGSAEDSIRRRWTAGLRATQRAQGISDDAELTRELLLEMLGQVDAVEEFCPNGLRNGEGSVGAQCYQGWLRLLTSLSLTPREVHDIGVEMRLELEELIVPLAREHLDVGSSVEARDRLTTDPAYRFPSDEAMLEESQRYLEAARLAMPTVVRVVPTDSLELVAVPEEDARNIAAAAFYNTSRDGAPARFFLNTVQAGERPRAASATAAFHEGWPGHHYQSAIHLDLEPSHPAVRGARSTAFVEGWGLYAERLADEMGLYPTPEDRIGYLLHMQDAMVALQVDAGLHAFGWSREQAIDTMVLVGGRPRAQAEQYADRHMGTPGQMVSYLLGYREFVDLREEAERKLGDHYDVRDFHEAVMAYGPIPLAVLRVEVRRWIETQAYRAARDDRLAALNFQECSSSRGPAECGLIQVPEDHAQPEGRHIDLNVKVIPGTGAGRPVFFLAGGPGQAAMDIESLVVSRFGAGLMDRDLVFVDQRGTGGSNPLGCETGAPEDPSRFFGPSYTEEELVSCLQDLGQRADVRLYTTEQFAQDLAAVADDFGYPRIDLVGGSYGTKAALVFMRMWPDRVGAAVLEGVAPPSFLNPLPHAKGGQAVLDRLLQACADQESCETAFPDLKTRFPALLARLETDPPLVQVPGTEVRVPLVREAMSYIVHLLLFNQQASTAVPALIDQVDRGEYAVLTSIYQQIVDGLVSGLWFGLQLSVTCTENAPRFDQIDLVAATADTYMGRDMVDGVLEQCGLWPAGRVTSGFWDPVTVDVPSLLITGGMDPATPPGFGETVAAGLTNARLVRVEEGAHVTPHPCIDSMVVSFLNNPDPALVDARCVAEVRRPLFQVPAGR